VSLCSHSKSKSSVPAAEKEYMKNPMVKFKIADDDDDDEGAADAHLLPPPTYDKVDMSRV